MYKVKTTFDTTYQFIVSWKLWYQDNSFLEFTHSDGKLTIIKIASILSIEQR